MQDFYWFIIFIAANSALLLLLGVNVSRLRIKKKIAWGDGEDKDLMKAIRTHANGTEQVPIYALIILALCFIKASTIVLSALVVVFTLSRVIQAVGMLFKQPLLRQVGAGLTFASQGFAVLALQVSLVL
ncbi:MAG: MAPEG family protein [Oceanospirillaceae bacterium]|nr:MAPEG family protein [Oceanospirillaceae bacterium]